MPMKLSPFVFLLLLGVILATHPVVRGSTDERQFEWELYCANKCMDHKANTRTVPNLACERGTCNPVANCEVDNGVEHGDFRQRMLDLHNAVRSRIATGAETRSGLSAASDMQALNYDYELEYTMQCWLNRCIYEHSRCHRTRSYSGAGQNLYITRHTHWFDIHAADNVLNAWYDEIEDVPDTSIIDAYESAKKGGVKVGHFLQVIWAQSTHIGCARVKLYNGSTQFSYQWMVGCNYGPSGNVKRHPVFLRGPACSKCNGGEPCTTGEYPGLCGRIEKIGPRPHMDFDGAVDEAQTGESGTGPLRLLVKLLLVHGTLGVLLLLLL